MRAIERAVRAQRAEVIATKRGTALHITSAFEVAQARASHPIGLFVVAYAKELARVRQGDDAAHVSLTWLRSPASGLEAARSHITSAIGAAASYASVFTLSAQNKAGTLAESHAAGLIAGLKPGTPLKTPNRVPLPQPPQGFDDLGDQASTFALHKTAAVASTGGGAAQMRQVLDAAIAAAMARAQTLADAETSAAYRSMFALSMQANEIPGWYWYADLGNACAGCTAMHGSFHTWDEDLDDHAHGNCMQVPYDGDRPDVQPGTAWLADADAETQRDVLGPAKYLAYRAGDLSLGDLASVDGGYVAEASLKSLGLDAGDYLE